MLTFSDFPKRNHQKLLFPKSAVKKLWGMTQGTSEQSFKEIQRKQKQLLTMMENQNVQKSGLMNSGSPISISKADGLPPAGYP